ncbi:MAG: HlyD family secretion protein [Minwuia sp.]|nr:HlyD family secretion protein [Minwuia sp.]
MNAPSTPELTMAGGGKPHNARRARIIRLGILAAVMGVALWFGGSWLHDRRVHVFIIDSRIASDMVTISAQEPGRVVNLHVGTGEMVSRGQVLVSMDQRTVRLRIAEAKAEIDRTNAQHARLVAERALIVRRNQSAMKVARAHIEVAQAGENAASASRASAETELKRGEQLFQRKVIAAQRLDALRTTFTNADRQLLQARAAVREAEAELGEVEAEQIRMAVIEQELTALKAEAAALQARLEQHEVALSDLDIISGIDGIIDLTFVEEGEYVRPGTRLLMLHDPDNVWVSANVKETELDRFQVGSTAVITIDAHPNEKVMGRVTWIGPAATSQFALLPNPNPSGNFTKVTQRVPVRIDISGTRERLRPGMMVEVAIDVDPDAARPGNAGNN